MTKTIEATFDGEVLRPDEPIELAPNTRVRVIIDTTLHSDRQPFIFLEAAQALRLEGPSDWAIRFEDYLYAQRSVAND